MSFFRALCGTDAKLCPERTKGFSVPDGWEYFGKNAKEFSVFAGHLQVRYFLLIH